MEDIYDLTEYYFGCTPECTDAWFENRNRLFISFQLDYLDLTDEFCEVNECLVY